MIRPDRPTGGLDRSLPAAPATGSTDPYFTELSETEEPVVVGTLFLSMILLMLVAGIWAVVYFELLGR